MIQKILNKTEIIHSLLFIISTFLNISLFIQFSNNPLYQVFWVIFAIVIEMAKDKLFYQIKVTCFYIISIKDLFRMLAPLALVFIMYLGFAYVSLQASAGFTLVSLQEQSFIAQAENVVITSSTFELDQVEADIIVTQTQINTKLLQQDKINFDLSIRSVEFDNQIAGLKLEKQKLIDKRTKLVNDVSDDSKETKFVASDVFSLLGGELYNVSGDVVMKSMMYLLAILLELFLIYTIAGVEIKNINKRKLKIFFNNLLTTDKKYLRSIKEISSISKLSYKECVEYFKLLESTRYDKDKLIVKKNWKYIPKFNINNLDPIVSLLTTKTKLT